MVTTILFLLGSLTVGQAVTLYPFGDSAGDSSLSATDDRPESKTILEPFGFYGAMYTECWISPNGYLSGKQDYEFEPFDFPLMSNPMIALFFDDHLPDHSGDGNIVHYRQISRDDPDNVALLDQITEDISTAFCQCERNFIATWACIITWDRVQHYPCYYSYTYHYYDSYIYTYTYDYCWYFDHIFEEVDPRNTYQVVLASDGSHSYVMFLYQDIEWTLYGAQVGFNSGDGRYLTLPGAMSTDVLDLEHTSNVGIPGRWMYRVDGDTIFPEPCPDECVCEFGDNPGKEDDILVKFDCSTKTFAWNGNQNADKTLVKLLDVSDPCRFKLVANTKKMDGGVVILANMEFEYGPSGGGPGDFSYKLKAGGSDIKLNGDTVNLNNGPVEDNGPPHVRLTLTLDEVLLVQSDDCLWRLEYNLAGNTYEEKVTFYTGTLGPFEGKCGTCS